MPDLKVLTACFYPPFADTHFRLRSTSGIFGVPIHCYGIGERFESWRQAKVTRLIQELESVHEQYMLYTDASDTWFTGGKDAIMEGFASYGARLLISAERECYPFPDLHDQFPDDVGVYRFPNAGQFMGETAYVLDVLRDIDATYHGRHDYNDQAYWLCGFADGRIQDGKIDHQCRVFQTTANETIGEDIEFSQGVARLRNMITGTNPSLVHFNGGGKEERMNEVFGR